MNTWDWFSAAVEHLIARPAPPGTPEHRTLLAVALYWARAKGTEWETGKNTSHSQRRAGHMLGLHHNTVGNAIRFWVNRGFMEVVKQQFDSSLVINLVTPDVSTKRVPPSRPADAPRRSDYPDTASWAAAVDEWMTRRGAA